MSTSPADALDPLLHPILRLRIAALVAQVDEIEFARLRELVDVSDSVLSKQLAALSEGGLVTLRKAARDGRQRTWIAFTREGRAAYRAHVQALQALAAAVA